MDWDEPMVVSDDEDVSSEIKKKGTHGPVLVVFQNCGKLKPEHWTHAWNEPCHLTKLTVVIIFAARAQPYEWLWMAMNAYESNPMKHIHKHS